MTTPLVSIIVPCYNQAQYLPEALDSVLAQTYTNWECIIVNDGSPDDTEEVAKAYCEMDKRFKYVYKGNGGVSSARNVGIKNSIGEYILPLDADDRINKIYLKKAIEQFQNVPNSKLIYCKAQLFGTENGEEFYPNYNYSTLLFENIIFCSAIYKKVDYDKTTGYNETLIQGLEDWDFWISLLDESDIVYQIPEICFYYRRKSISRNKSLTKQIEQDLQREIYNNHQEKYKKHILDLIWNNIQMQRQQSRILSLEAEIKAIRHSHAYRLGKFILKPFSFIRHRIL